MTLVPETPQKTRVIEGVIVMEHAAVKDYVKIPKQEYNLLKEVYRTVKRQALHVRIDEAERNLAAGKTKTLFMFGIIAEKMGRDFP